MWMIAALFPSTAVSFSRPEDVAALLARASVGLMFALSGWYKLFDAGQFDKIRETLQEAGIPAPRATAKFVSACELAFGAALTLGFLTPLSAAVLLVICVVALITVTAKEIEGTGLGMRLSSFLYMPEWLLILLLAWIVSHGLTGASIDALILSRAS